MIAIKQTMIGVSDSITFDFVSSCITPTVICVLLIANGSSLPAAEGPSWRTAWKHALAAAKDEAFTHAIQQAVEARRLGLNDPEINYVLGRWYFQNGNAKKSVEAFDAYLKDVPQRTNSLWERGISCYYAKQFQAGSQQFENYQKYHNNDVENAVWRYLCQSQFDGKEKARKAILPIQNDRRVPMMEVYKLFKGELTPQDVLKAIERSKANGEQAKVNAMHAHLYLGLYYDSEGQSELARKHMDLAVSQFKKRGGYMWSVAVVHAKKLQLEEQVPTRDSKEPIINEHQD